MKVVLHHTEETAQNIQTFWFKPEKPLRYIAGQFVELRIPHDNKDRRGDKRWFTLSSSPTDELVSITTKFADPSSSFKTTLKNLRPGDIVDMSSPMGDFVLPKDSSIPLLFVAGGIGVTPFHSMISWLQDTGEKRDIKLLYSARVIEEVSFKTFLETATDELDIIISEPPENWNGLVGRLTANQILQNVTDPENRLIYLSGPEQMIESLEKDLKHQGFNKKHIRTDFFPNYTEI
jgi:glycine betaine catabolism B